jgi:hypothetical protein
MKSLPTDDIQIRATAGLLSELSLAVRAGRLVTLLKGEGLSKSTVEELLRPESASALKTILTDRLFRRPERGTQEDGRDLEREPGERPRDGSGKDREARREREDDQAIGSSYLFRSVER